MEFVFLLLCAITGASFLNFASKENKLSNYFVLSLPLGIVIHTIIFLFLSFFRIYYEKYLFITISLISIISFKKKRKIENDMRRIPWYFLIFLVYITVKLLQIANTGFMDFYNFDEFTAYQTTSTITYLSHNITEIYNYYAPINYFIGIMSLEFSGLSIIAARLVCPFFYGLTSLGIYMKLRNSKVNRHISALSSMLFLVCSSELLQLAKSFYTNIYFMSFFVLGTYEMVEHFLIEKKKGIPWVAFFMCMGALLTRREAIYFMILVVLVTSLIALWKKNINKKECLIMNLPLLFPIIYKTIETANHIIVTFSKNENKGTLFEMLVERLSPNNLNLWFKNLLSQTLQKDYYYFNWLIYTILIITILSVIVIFIKKKRKKAEDKKYLSATALILFFEFVYIGIVLFTQIFIFYLGEWQVAASFSRYVNSIVVINFITLIALWFHDTDSRGFIKKQKKENKPLDSKKARILLIIPAYNEEENILSTYQQVMDYNKKEKTNYECIVINDGSTDNTEEILQKNKIPHIQLIQNLGIGGAVQTGYKYAKEHDYDIAIQFDGDGQHDVRYVKNLVEPIIEGKADLTIGSRFTEKNYSEFQSTFIRRVGIKFISFLILSCTGEKILDTTSGFRAANKKIIHVFAKN